MKQNLLFILVVIAILANDMEDQRRNFRQNLRKAREKFWERYENVVYRVLDEVETWKTQPED